MDRPRAVVLLSGGVDSCVTAAIARLEFDLALLHINYGQRTERRELRAFNEIADHFSVTARLVASLEHLTAIGGSSLTDPRLNIAKARLDNKDIPTSYVPFRNASMLSIAVSWSEVIGASAIFVGAVQEDSSGYPDCRREFFDSFQRVIDTGTKPETSIALKTPVIDLSKAEIVKIGQKLGAPFALTWSCYKNEARACGECDSCALRLRGFQSAGVDDPIPYERKPVYLHT